MRRARRLITDDELFGLDKMDRSFNDSCVPDVKVLMAMFGARSVVKKVLAPPFTHYGSYIQVLNATLSGSVDLDNTVSHQFEVTSPLVLSFVHLLALQLLYRALKIGHCETSAVISSSHHHIHTW